VTLGAGAKPNRKRPTEVDRLPSTNLENTDREPPEGGPQDAPQSGASTLPAATDKNAAGPPTVTSFADGDVVRCAEHTRSPQARTWAEGASWRPAGSTG
jgi:hypothetical protein